MGRLVVLVPQSEGRAGAEKRGRMHVCEVLCIAAEDPPPFLQLEHKTREAAKRIMQRGR